jgi:hypothetical protein
MVEMCKCTRNGRNGRNGNGKKIDGKVAGCGRVKEDGNGGTFDGFETVGRWERECCRFMWTEGWDVDRMRWNAIRIRIFLQ